MVQLFERAINGPEALRYGVFYATSDNQYQWVDIGHTREVLGYTPQDRAEGRLREQGEE